MTRRYISVLNAGILLLLSFIVIPEVSSAQEMIRLKAGMVYKVNILERTADSLKYSLVSTPQVTFTVPLESLDSIWTMPPPPPVTEVTATAPVEPVRPPSESPGKFSMKAVRDVVRNNPASYEEYLVAERYHKASLALVIPISVIGVYLKYSWVSSYFYDNTTVDAIVAGAGLMLVGWAIAFDQISHKHLDRALKIYHNEPLQSKPRPLSMGFGGTANGIGVVFTF